MGDPQTLGEPQIRGAPPNGDHPPNRSPGNWGTSAPQLEPPAPEPERFTRSGRQVRTPSRFLQSMMSVANYDGTNELWFQDVHPLLMLMKATNNPDILTFSQAMRAEDRERFREAMLKEVRDHEKRGHWKIVPRSQVRELGGTKVLPAVWAMARRREILSKMIEKWKSRLNLGGHRMIEGIDFDLTWSPVAAWPTIRVFLVMFLLNGWVTAQLDLVLAYPHAKVDRPTFMEIPRGFRSGDDGQVLQILRNLYGGKASGRIYFQFLCSYLERLGFTQSKWTHASSSETTASCSSMWTTSSLELRRLKI